VGRLCQGRWKQSTRVYVLKDKGRGTMGSGGDGVDKMGLERVQREKRKYCK
jgi:hypothetical protein